MSAYTTKLFWPLLSLGVLAGSLGCIINDGRAKGECDGLTTTTCDGDKIVYCDTISIQGRNTPGKIVRATCDLGCETFFEGAQCKSECQPSSESCVDDKTVERCVYYSPAQNASKADDSEPISPYSRNSYHKKELESCPQDSVCETRSNGFSVFAECVSQMSAQDMGPSPDMSQPPRDMGPSQDMSGAPDMGSPTDMGGAADLGPAQDMSATPDMGVDMSDMGGPVQPDM